MLLNTKTNDHIFMQIATLDITPSKDSPKLKKQVNDLNSILIELNTMNLENDLVLFINERVAQLSNLKKEKKSLTKAVRKERVSILKEVEKKAKIVVKGHYRNLWMAVGMSAFGLPLGFLFSMLIDNYGFLGIGLPIGMAIGLALGTGMDEKAKKEGRQLNLAMEM